MTKKFVPGQGNRSAARFQPVRVTRVSSPTEKEKTEKEKPKPGGMTQEAALKALVELFDYNATSRNIEQGPYAGKMPKPTRCMLNIGAQFCNLATKKDPKTDKFRQYCDFHHETQRGTDAFKAAGYSAEQIYENSTAEAEIRERAAKLKPPSNNGV